MSDFEVNDTGTRRALTETEIKMESIKAEARLIMDTYAESTVAHQAAKRMFDSLTDDA